MRFPRPCRFVVERVKVPKYPEEEITAKEAMYRSLEAAAVGKEVRICDGGDMLVYHCKGAVVLYPQPIGDFWEKFSE